LTVPTPLPRALDAANIAKLPAVPKIKNVANGIEFSVLSQFVHGKSSMITIGIRASPTAVTFAIYDSNEKKVVNIEEIKVPAALATPDALKYIRSNLLDVLREFKVEKAGIRASEPNARNLSIDRIYIEGVIQEAFASSNLLAYYMSSQRSDIVRINAVLSLLRPSKIIFA
jgi:hypothetical protein